MGRPRERTNPCGTFRWCCGCQEWLLVDWFAPTAHYCYPCAAYNSSRSQRRRSLAQGKVPQRWYRLGQGALTCTTSSWSD